MQVSFLQKDAMILSHQALTGQARTLTEAAYCIF